MSGRGLLARRASSALISQGLTALASLVLQLVAARTLGASGYGLYALCVSVLITATALYTGWVGDSLTVLDRFEPQVRAAVSVSMIVGVVGGFLAGLGYLLAFGGSGWLAAVLLGALITCWLLEETGRRTLMARQEFGKLVINDGTYFAAALLALGAGWLLGVPWSLEELLGAMIVGAVAAILLAVIQLPRKELSALRPGLAGLRTVAAFAAWRSGQATLRPASLLVARLLVQSFGSLAAVGAMEAARLLLAPAQTVISGAGSFLLSTFVSAERNGSRGRSLANFAVWFLVAVVVLVGIVAALLLKPLGWLITGGHYALSAVAVIGWAVYLATWAATLPYVTEIVARQRSRDVFVVRLVDSVLGAAAALVVLAFGLGYPWVPWGMSIGGVVAAVWLRRIALRTRPGAVAAGRHRVRRVAA